MDTEARNSLGEHFPGLLMPSPMAGWQGKTTHALNHLERSRQELAENGLYPPRVVADDPCFGYACQFVDKAMGKGCKCCMWLSGSHVCQLKQFLLPLTNVLGHKLYVVIFGTQGST